MKLIQAFSLAGIARRLSMRGMKRTPTLTGEYSTQGPFLTQARDRFATLFRLKVDLHCRIEVLHQSLPEGRSCQVSFLSAAFTKPVRQVGQPAEHDLVPTAQLEERLVKH